MNKETDKKKKIEASDEKKKYNQGTYIGVGIALGVAFGVATDNIGLGIALGVAIGAGLDANKMKDEKENKKD